MLTLRATLTNDRLAFQSPFTPPAQAVEVLVTFVEEPASLPAAPEATPQADFGAHFHWDESRALLHGLAGKPMSQIVIEDREDRF